MKPVLSDKFCLYERKNFATFDELENLYKRMKDAMIYLEFLNPKHPRLLMQRIRQIINRSKIDKDELNLIHGIITAILKTKPHEKLI